MKITRKKEREIIILALYAYELSGNDPDEIIEYVLNQNKLTEKTEFIEHTVKAVIEKQNELDEIIARNLENYRLERLALVDLQIIRFATYEMLTGEAPTISINEAVELAKKYTDLDDGKASRFINSVLDKIKDDILK